MNAEVLALHVELIWGAVKRQMQYGLSEQARARLEKMLQGLYAPSYGPRADYLGPGRVE